MVICKQPIAGRVKTRMCPPLSPQQAAALAQAALSDTFAAVNRFAPARRIAVHEGPTTDWIPRGWEQVAQRGGGLDERLADAFDDVMTDGLPALLVAMDTPQLSVEQLRLGAELLMQHDAVIGLTDDGGYWIIGLRSPNRSVFVDVPMSVETTGQLQVERLHSLGLSVGFLEQLTDIDTIGDVEQVASRFPELATSRWWNEMVNATTVDGASRS
jgi:rSAM/selenodomain-associated transferase 1